MEVVLLGTGFPFPQPDRAGPATLVRAGGKELLFDAGRGVLLRLAGAGLAAPALTRVCLTHLHSDHTTDFNDIVTTHWLSCREPTPLAVIGPSSTADYCEETKHLLRHDIAWRIEYTPDLLPAEPTFSVTEREDGVVYDEDGVRVIVAPTEHPPVRPTIGYRVEHDGKTVVIGGDSVPCEGLNRLCEGADAYVQTVFRKRLMGDRAWIFRYHSSTEDAARTAAAAGVKKLVFTHMMPAVRPGTEQDWINDAKEHFDGEVIVGVDLQRIGV
jgi:ribonuclease Z